MQFLNYVPLLLVPSVAIRNYAHVGVDETTVLSLSPKSFAFSHVWTLLQEYEEDSAR